MSREESIRATHAGLDLATLEALANKGLLRRAQKDLDRGGVGDVTMAKDGLAVTVGEQRVCLVEAGPAKATCSCPAAGTCQHILAACLHLMREPSPEGASSSPPATTVREEWLSLDDSTLVTHFGMPVMSAAHDLLARHLPTIDESETFTVRFPALNAAVRAVPGGGLEGLIVTGATEQKWPTLAAASLLAVRREGGKTWEPPASGAAAGSPAPQHRESVLQAAAALCEETVSAGLARLSSSTIQRLESLSVSAQTAELYRLSLLLQRLATLGNDWLERRPHADLSVLFSQLAEAYALSQATLKKPQPHLTGQAREQYAEMGALDLTGVAGWPWSTPSGYEGLTVLFWDSGGQQWCTWSEARPRAFQGGFSAVARWTQPGPWEGAECPAQVARSSLRLIQARRNRWGRLSSSTRSRAIVVGPAKLKSLSAPVMSDWGELSASLHSAVPLGLKERDPRAAYVILQPAIWDRQPFDPVSQSLVWRLLDGKGQAIRLVAPFDTLTKPLIEALEKLSPQDLEGSFLVARCFRDGGGIQAFPLALHNDKGPVPLFFPGNKSAQAASQKKAPPPPPEDDDIEEMETPPSPAELSALEGWAHSLISGLEWVAESGYSRDAGEKVEPALENQARNLGLSKLAALLNELRENPAACRVLRLRWIAGVMLQSQH